MTEPEPLNLRVHDWEGILSDCVILKSEADLILEILKLEPGTVTFRRRRVWSLPVTAEAHPDSVCLLSWFSSLSHHFPHHDDTFPCCLRPLAKLITATTKHRIQSEEVPLRAWSLLSNCSQAAAEKVKGVATASHCNNVPELFHSFWYNSWLPWAQGSTMENWTRLFSFRTALFKRFIVKMCQWKNPQRC